MQQDMVGKNMSEPRQRSGEQTWLRPPRAIVEHIEALLELGKSDTAIRNHHVVSLSYLVGRGGKLLRGKIDARCRTCLSRQWWNMTFPKLRLPTSVSTSNLLAIGRCVFEGTRQKAASVRVRATPSDMLFLTVNDTD